VVSEHSGVYEYLAVRRYSAKRGHWCVCVCVCGEGGWIIACLCVLSDNGDNAKHLLEYCDSCRKG